MRFLINVFSTKIFSSFNFFAHYFIIINNSDLVHFCSRLERAFIFEKNFKVIFSPKYKPNKLLPFLNYAEITTRECVLIFRQFHSNYTMRSQQVDFFVTYFFCLTLF